MRSFVTEILIPSGQVTLKNQSQAQARDSLYFRQDQERGKPASWLPPGLIPRNQHDDARMSGLGLIPEGGISRILIKSKS